MRSRVLSILATTILVAALVVLTVAGHTEADPLVVELIAGQHIDAGDVKVWNDGTNLYVSFITTGDWELVETHVHVATTPEGIPQKNGNPIPGKFKYRQTSQPYSIPLGSWGTGTQLFIAAHAVVANSKTGQTETAWGALSDGYGYGYGFSGKNWATYFPYSVQ